MSWDSSNVVCFTERSDPKSGLSYFVITSGGYFCNVFLREDMKLLFQSQSPKEWTSRTPLTREQIARETTRLNEDCEARGLRLERVPDRHAATPRVSTVEILETDVGGGRATMAVRNGYFIKEDLKPLGFKWGGTHAGNPNREWRIPNGLHLEERREIARKIDMACVQVKFMDLRCKYLPLTRTISEDVAPAVTSAVATPTEARPTKASGVPEVRHRELVTAMVLRAPSHGGDSLTGGGGVSTLKTEIPQPPIKNEQPSTTATDEPVTADGVGSGKDNIDLTNTGTIINSSLEKVAQAPTAITKKINNIASRPFKSRKTPITLPEYFAAARNKNGATSTTSTSTNTEPTSPSSTTPSKTQMSSCFVENGERRLFVFGQKFNIGNKKITPRNKNPRHNMLPFRLDMGSSMATTEGSAASTIKHKPGNSSIPPTLKYSSSTTTGSANSASSPASSSAVMYPPSPQKEQDVFNVPMFAYRNDDTPLFAHHHGDSHSTSSTERRTRDISGRCDADNGVDYDSDSNSGGGGRRLENDFGDIPLVCREPPSWVSLAFSSETCQPRFSPMMSSGGKGQENEEGDTGGERSPCWPPMLHSVEVSVGGRGLQARRAMQCLLSSSSSGARGGPLDGVLVWRNETGCWWSTACGTQVWGSKRNVTLDFLRASLETMTALVVGVEFRDLTEGAEKTPPLKCRKHDRDLLEEEDEQEEKDLEKAVSGGVSGTHLRRPRTRRMVSICPVNRESCTMIPHDGLLSKQGKILHSAPHGRPSDPPAAASISTSDDGTEKAGQRVAEIGQEICSSFAKRLNMDNAD